MSKIDTADQKLVMETSALGYEHQDIRRTLDMLRKTRKARGGTGEPLKVPDHLRDAAAGVGVTITDADMDPRSHRTKEQDDDENSDTARQVNRSE